MRDPGGWIGTHTGTKFWPLEPQWDEICIEDIAHSLALQCRFNGHCAGFYSVAEHSIELSRLVPEEDALWGLLHDAAEAYLGDVVRPLKRECGYTLRRTHGFVEASYGHVERELLALIGRRFGLSLVMPPAVREADDRMLATEREQLFGLSQPPWDCVSGIQPYSIRLRCLDWGLAEAEFLTRFQELTSDG